MSQKTIAAIAGLADVLLPGDGLFPSATASGAIPSLLVRVSAADKGRLIDDLLAALAAAGPASPATAARIEADAPKLFDEFRTILFLTYYEQDSVILAIRSLGTPYNWAPLPEGYPPEAFNPATDAPKHHRGRWIPTERVAPVDLTKLDQLRMRQP